MSSIPEESGSVNTLPRQQRRAQQGASIKEYERRWAQESAAFRREVQEAVESRVKWKFQDLLEGRRDEVVGRPVGKWGDRKDKTEVPEYCRKCGTHLRWQFHRDGYDPRTLRTSWAVMELGIPRLACRCGGSVEVDYGLFDRYQRRYEDLDAELLGLSGLCLSLRQIQMVLDLKGQHLSIGTVCAHIGQVADYSEACFGEQEAPPVVALDGIWVNLATQTGEEFTNKAGKRRKRKKVRKVPLLVAWGIWPSSGKRALLGWVVGEKEDEASWQKLLELLHQRGIHADGGLRLFISDGSSGLEAALAMVSFGKVAHQRCVFHKMRNVLDAVKGEEKATPAEKRERRKAVLNDLVPVWQAESEEEARQRVEAFAAKWQEKEPLAVARLQHGLDATLVYFRVQEEARREGQCWPSTFLRTTSSLERLNRRLRRKLRQATQFQSEKGLRANAYLAAQCPGDPDPGGFSAWATQIAADTEQSRVAAQNKTPQGF